MKSRFLVVATILLTCFGLSANAQHLVRGKVVDGSGEPIPGASVVISRTQTGVMTDYEAKFYEQGIKINRCVAVMEGASQ